MFTRRLLLPGIQKVVTVCHRAAGALAPMLNKLNRRFAGALCCVLYLATFDYVYPVHDVAALV